MRPVLALVLVLTATLPVRAKELVLTPGLHHLRIDGPREWSDFPEKPESANLTLTFPAGPNEGEQTLRLRQQDVKQTWKVLLNGKDLARLRPDENDMVVYLPVPAGMLRNGENRLVIEQADRTPDDIRIGEIVLDDRPLAKILSAASVALTVREEGIPGSPALPCRITVLNAQGALMTVGAVSSNTLAVRPGVLDSADGTFAFGLPAGDYTFHAGRGFAYSVATLKVTVGPGERLTKTLTIRREVPTPGYVSCDPHVHSLTYSGHGDATIDERVLAIAGEDIALPIATEHNRHSDYTAAAERLKVGRYFTPVIGNEVTTAVGHYNVFPLRADDPVPDFKGKDWKSLYAGIRAVTGDTGVIVLNHPRDLHSGFRPFGPERHVALVGEDLDGWPLEANAVEVVNSGAQQSDVMRPIHDWFGLLNRGLSLTPIGASDSHDVSRFLVGQARTYVRTKSDNPGAIDVAEAVASLRAGRVLVSCGLLAEITVNGKYGPGDRAPGDADVKVEVRVRGPGWTTAEHVELYANGMKIRAARIEDGHRAGVKWEGTWTLPRFTHDVHLVAVATGPGMRDLFWPIAKPYQPTAPESRTRVIGVTGAVWIDGDGDGKRTSARGYAERLWRQADGAWSKLVPALGEYDEAVAAQAAALLRGAGVSLQDAGVRAARKKAGPQVDRGFQNYAEAWRASEIARARR